MSVTFATEPMIEEDARRYAEANGVTLESLVLDYLKSIARRESSRVAMRDANASLRSLAGTWITDDEAEKTLGEMRTIDWEIWK